jgi:hypothetical protein
VVKCLLAATASSCEGAQAPGCLAARVPWCAGARVPGCLGARLVAQQPGCGQSGRRGIGNRTRGPPDGNCSSAAPVIPAVCLDFSYRDTTPLP